MNDLSLRMCGAQHQMYAALLRVAATIRRDDPADLERSDRDRGAVSLEQVLWFVAAGVSVVVIAGILWSQVKEQAEDSVTPPQAP